MKVINKREEIVKRLKKIVKNSSVFYETFFDGFHYTTFHIITDKFRFYFKIDDEIMLNGDINALLRHVIIGYSYNMYSEVFNTKEYNKYMEGE